MAKLITSSIKKNDNEGTVTTPESTSTSPSLFSKFSKAPSESAETSSSFRFNYTDSTQIDIH